MQLFSMSFWFNLPLLMETVVCPPKDTGQC